MDEVLEFLYEQLEMAIKKYEENKTEWNYQKKQVIYDLIESAEA